ncbi:mechanosensitive ion channel protein 8-like [Silene latifolia]|uniref:mechanosensitive ion channel protein 8-like n=1 Tax=Silene latifolia TaxID=37657 RepID=UPI003D77785D
MSKSPAPPGDPTSGFSVKIDPSEDISFAKSPLESQRIWREASYDFDNSAPMPRKGVKKGSNSGSSDGGDDEDDDVSDEFDFQKHRGKGNPSLTPVYERDGELVRRRSVSEDGQHFGKEGDHVVQCTSNASFQQKSTKSGLMKMKSKSRLMDPPPVVDKRSGRVENRSGMLGKSMEIEEDDPFDDDLPEDYKKGKISIFFVVQWVCLILIVAALVCSLVIRKWRGKTMWGMQLWKWEVMGLVLICGGLVSGWLIRIVVFFIERNFLLRKRVLYFVYGLRSSVQKFLWLGWALLAWILILDKNIEKETKSQVLPYVTKILICFMVATLLWLIKTLLLKVLALNFHVTAFFDRIQDALFNQYVIETLSRPPYLELQQIQEEEARVMSEVTKLQNAGVHIPAHIRENCLPKSPLSGKSPRIGKSPMSSKRHEQTDDSSISIDHLHRLNQKNVSAWNMKKLMRSVRKGVLSTLDDHLDPRMEDDTAMQIRSEKEAKAAAKKIFTNVAKPGSRHIYKEDLMRFLREEKASRTMLLFEGAGDGKGISKRALKNWVVNVFTERRALALSLNDTKTAVNKLHHLVNILVGIAVIIIWLLILGVPVTHFFVFVSSQILVLAFMFGNTCKTTFEAIVFLFFMHPFDVGDRCEIEGVQMVVEEMNILTTVFLKFDNHKVIYPNSVLATKPISNYYRSPDMRETIDLSVHISTPVEKISLMKERITRYIEHRKEQWYPGPKVIMKDVEDMNRIKITVWVYHTMNYQNMGERWARRSHLVEEMIRIFRDLNIEYRMLPTDVNVRNMPAIVSDRVPSNWTLCAR